MHSAGSGTGGAVVVVVDAIVNGRAEIVMDEWSGELAGEPLKDDGRVWSVTV